MKTQNKRLNEPIIRIISLVKKALTRSPFDKWEGRLKHLKGPGRIIPEFPDLPYREVIVSPYRFFYKVKADAVWVVAVWHGAQIPEKPARQSDKKRP